MVDAAAAPGADLALARLLQLASAASPVGSFAWSDGLEQAVAAGAVCDESGARDWIEGLLVYGTGALDLPLLLRMQAAWAAGDAESALRDSDWLLACRETAELRAADRHQGQALRRVLATLWVGPVARLADEPRLGYACCFALAAHEFGVTPRAAGLGFVYAWLENQVLAAVKLVPLGQSAGQRLLFELAAALPALVGGAERLALDDIAAGAPGQAMASALHEVQYTRLYRS